MRIALFTALLLTGAASVAVAQEEPYSQTLDGQMQRVQSGQTPVPVIEPVTSAEPEAPAAAVPDKISKEKIAKKPVKAAARKPIATEWPASASAPVSPPQPYAPAPVYKARDGEVIDSVGGDAIPALPLTVYTSKSVKYVTGGVGDEEMAQLKSIENDFNLRVLISAGRGEYVGDATVKVLDEQGAEVITVGDAGPYFYASLIPGNYSVEVTNAAGMSKKATTKVPNAAGQKLVIRF